MNKEIKKITRWINISIVLTLTQFTIMSYMVAVEIVDRDTYFWATWGNGIIFCACMEVRRCFKKYVATKELVDPSE